MSIMKRWAGRFFGLTQPEPWAAFFGTETHTGKPVTPEMAMQLAAVWACVKVTSQAVASLPLDLYVREPNGGRRWSDHPLGEIISSSPNSDMTAIEFWESMTGWICTHGNAFAEIVREGGRVIALNLIPADHMHVSRDAHGDLQYRFTDRGKPYVLPAESCLHIRGFGLGGDLGLNPIRFGANVIGNAYAAEQTAGKMFNAGLMPSGLLETDQAIDETQRDQLGKILDQYVGSERAGKTLIMEAGLKYRQLSLDPETSQLLETRRFSTEAICTFFGTPPVVIGHAAPGVTQWGTGVEAIQLQWLSVGLNPFLKRIEARIRKQLLQPGERATTFAEFNREALMQMDSATKISFLSSSVQNGLTSRNEGRAKINFPKDSSPLADALTVQSNLVPLDKLGTPDPAATIRGALGIGDEAK